MKDDLQSYRKSDWSIKDIKSVSPQLVVVQPYGQEGTYDIQNEDGSVAGRLLVDHNWDETFGYAFGVVYAIGDEAQRRYPELKHKDFINFTRCAYTDAKDKFGQQWLFMHWQDIQGIVEDFPTEAIDAPQT